MANDEIMNEEEILVSGEVESGPMKSSTKKLYNTSRSRIPRDAETRIAEIRKMRVTNSQSLDVPYGAIRDGFSAHWGRMSVVGIEDHRVEALVAKGYEIVPRERVKDYIVHDPLKRHRGEQKYITKGNELVLMEYPTALLEEENEAFARKCQKKMEAIPFKNGNNPNIIGTIG